MTRRAAGGALAGRNQKSQAERNHKQLRRILPKGRSDFDRLSRWDVSACCRSVNRNGFRLVSPCGRRRCG